MNQGFRLPQLYMNALHDTTLSFWKSIWAQKEFWLEEEARIKTEKKEAFAPAQSPHGHMS